MPISKLKAVAPYVLTFAASVYLYYLATQFDFTRSGDRLGPDFWPKLILALMMAMCLYEILKLMIFGEREIEGVLDSIIEESGEVATEPEQARTYIHLLLLGIVLTVAYVALIETLGFFLDTFAYLALFMYLGRYRNIGVILASSGGGALIFMYVFMKIVYVSLPIGTGPFAGVSLLLMRLLGIR